MNETEMMHGHEWRAQKVNGWFACEKLHGCRAYWDGADMWSRGGQLIHLPERIRAGLPVGFPLDGEIFAGRAEDGFWLACEAVNYDRWDVRCRFKVFDAPQIKGGWMERITAARRRIGLHAYVQCVPGVVVRNLAHAVHLMEWVQSRRGEGIMLHDPEAEYRAGRHRTLLKMKRVPHGLRL